MKIIIDRNQVARLYKEMCDENLKVAFEIEGEEVVEPEVAPTEIAEDAPKTDVAIEEVASEPASTETVSETPAAEVSASPDHEESVTPVE